MAAYEMVKVLPKGQITIPREFRSQMNISEGDRITVTYDNGRLVIMNPIESMMKILESKTQGLAKKAGIKSEDDAMAYAVDFRKGDK